MVQLRLKLICLPLIIVIRLLLSLLLVLQSIIILGEQSLGLVMNEVAKYLKAISLLDRFLLEEFSYYCDPLSELLHLTLFLLSLLLDIGDVSLSHLQLVDPVKQLPSLIYKLIVSFL